LFCNLNKYRIYYRHCLVSYLPRYSIFRSNYFLLVLRIWSFWRTCNIDWLITSIYCFTSRSRIFHLYGDVTITGEGLQNLVLCSALMAFEQGGIFIVPHPLRHGASVFPVSSEGPPHSVASYDIRGDSNPDPHWFDVTRRCTFASISNKVKKMQFCKYIIILSAQWYMNVKLFCYYLFRILMLPETLDPSWVRTFEITDHSISNLK
jgi:hypothetical protein